VSLDYNQIYNLSKNINKLKKRINNDLLKKDFTKDKIIALILKIMVNNMHIMMEIIIKC
jgi:hypothetical protein